MIWSSVLVQFQKTLLDILGKIVSFIMSSKMMDTGKSMDDRSLDLVFFTTIHVHFTTLHVF